MGEAVASAVAGVTTTLAVAVLLLGGLLVAVPTSWPTRVRLVLFASGTVAANVVAVLAGWAAAGAP